VTEAPADTAAGGAETPRPRKAEQTKARIVDAALELFLQHGYDGTTMRAIATKAGVSVGNAYYYFDSKEHLIQEYYSRIVEQHLVAARPVLQRERSLQARLAGVVSAHVDIAQPYHDFAGVLFKTAADPKSPLSPFSSESGPARERSIELFTELLEGSDAKVTKDLRGDLPELLWLYQLGITLYWVHDESPGAARTRLLIERTTPLVDRLVNLSRLPVLRPIARQIVTTIRELRELDADTAT
jgi:AcrR family transcriptional regulator